MALGDWIRKFYSRESVDCKHHFKFKKRDDLYCVYGVYKCTKCGKEKWGRWK